MSYQILADSNPRRPMAGQVVVSVNRFLGVFRRPLYRWLRESFEPVDRIAGSYLVFEVSPEELERALSRGGVGE